MNQNEIKFVPLGGSGEIGMNLNLYQYQGQWLMLDLGITFGEDLGIDIILPDIQMIEEDKSNLCGLVVTHGHEDHIGAIPYLWERLKCPIYATPFTMELVRGKLADVGLLDKVPLHLVNLLEPFKVGPFTVEMLGVTHSIPESCMVSIKTPNTSIVHTGDWKFDPNPLVGEPSDKKRLQELGDEGVHTLVCDSTNVFQEGHSDSEEKVRTNLIELISKQKKRVAIGMFASNIARLKTCWQAAQETNREVVLVGRSLEKMVRAARATGYLEEHVQFLGEDDAKSVPREKALLICTGSQGEQRAALPRIADGTHPRVKLDAGDAVIFSSRVIPGNELAIAELKNTLEKHEIDVISHGEEFIHVSGHPYQGELKELYELTRPKLVIPVHGETQHLHRHAQFAKECGITHAIAPHNGVVIQITDGEKDHKPAIVGEVPSGRLALDGRRAVPFHSHHMKERQIMMRDGVVCLTLPVSQYEVGEPMLSFAGLASTPDEEKRMRAAVMRELAHTLRKLSDTDLFANDKIDMACRRAVRKAVKAISGHRPFVLTHILR